MKRPTPRWSDPTWVAQVAFLALSACSGASTNFDGTERSDSGLDGDGREAPDAAQATPADAGDRRDSDRGQSSDAIVDEASADGADAEASQACSDPSRPALWVDCSGHCPSAVADASTVCGGGSAGGLVCPTYSLAGAQAVVVPPGDITLRTPGGSNAACQPLCANPAVTSALIFRTGAGEAPSGSSITVPAPWHINVVQFGAYGQGPDAASVPAVCARVGSVDGCALIYQLELVIVWTEAANPPPADVVIRSGATCP